MNKTIYNLTIFWNHSGCDRLSNPWCDRDGTGKTFELVFLFLVSIVGTLGNLIVIASIIAEKKVHKFGNIFIINLAVADVMITGIFVPTCIAHVINNGNALDQIMCRTMGYLSTMCCICSMTNLMFIAIDRYCAIIQKKVHKLFFSKRRSFLIVAFTWIWSNVVASPTLWGLSGLVYDEKRMACSWDNKTLLMYNVIFIILAVMIPLCMLLICYFNLFRAVRSQSRVMTIMCRNGSFKRNNKRCINFLRREMCLIKTLILTVLVFIICWTPFALCILIDPRGINYHLKKVVGRLAIANSGVNFLIYGVMNRRFRNGYFNLIACVCRRNKFSRTSKCLQLSRQLSSTLHRSWGWQSNTSHNSIRPE